MQFIKKFFDDESTIVGLCGFDSLKPKTYSKTANEELFFNFAQMNKIFETNFKENVFL